MKCYRVQEEEFGTSPIFVVASELTRVVELFRNAHSIEYVGEAEIAMNSTEVVVLLRQVCKDEGLNMKVEVTPR